MSTEILTSIALVIHVLGLNELVDCQFICVDLQRAHGSREHGLDVLEDLHSEDQRIRHRVRFLAVKAVHEGCYGVSEEEVISSRKRYQQNNHVDDSSYLQLSFFQHQYFVGVPVD